MRIQLVCNFRDFYIESGLEIEIHGVRISNNKAPLQQIVDKEMFIAVGGYITHGWQESKCAIGYLNGSFETKTQDEKQEFLEFAMRIKDNVQAFLSTLWFVKDCSGFLYEYVAFCPDNDVFYLIPASSYFTPVVRNSENTVFSKEDINIAVKIWNKLREIKGAHWAVEEPHYKLSESGYRLPTINDVSYNDSNRLYRASLFLSYARAEAFIIMKISLYIPLFECLFSSGNTEVTHKVAERCSFYIGGSAEEKIETYDLMTIAYDIRSKFLHGSTLSKKKAKGGLSLLALDTQILICKQVDELARMVLTKAILEDSDVFVGDEESHSKYFKQLLFS